MNCPSAPSSMMTSFGLTAIAFVKYYSAHHDRLPKNP
jgi:hypothetical protein